MDLKNYDIALDYCSKIENLFSQIQDEDLKYDEVLFDYYQAQIFNSIKNKEKATYYADKALETINSSEKTTTSLLDEEGLKLIKETIRRLSKSRKPIIANKKYNRNEVLKVEYLDGRIVEKKYKKVEDDIRFGRCKVIE